MNRFGLLRIISRLGGFGATALLSGLINVATIPIVVASVGATAWASIAAGQAVGIIGSIVMQLGWGVTGPAEIAATHDDMKRKHIYRESIAYRLLILPPILVLVFLVSWLIVPSTYSLASSIAGVGSSLLGLTAAWYFVGKGDPVALMKLDTLPRILSTAAGAATLIVFPYEIVFSLAILASSLMPFLMASYSISKGGRNKTYRAYLSIPRAKELAREQAPGIIASIVSQAYRYLPLILITAVRPEHAATYALIDRIVKFAEAAVKPLSQSLQSWVPAAGSERLVGRVWAAMLIASIAGVASCLLFISVAPFASDVLGTEVIEISAGYYHPAAIALGLTVVTQMGMLALLALGQRTSVALSVSVGGGVGLAVLWPAVIGLGAAGGLYCLVLAETAVLVIQVAVLFRQAKLGTRTDSDTASRATLGI